MLHSPFDLPHFQHLPFSGQKRQCRISRLFNALHGNADIMDILHLKHFFTPN
jgi:hypothetical protein